MRVVVAIPVVGLLAGAACGLYWTDIPGAVCLAVLLGWAALAIHAVRTRSTELLTASVAGAFSVGGALLASHAWYQAWRPPLRVLFEAMVPDARADVQHSGRAAPVDVSVPMLLVGVLRS